MRISAVILSCNSERFLEKCVRSLAAALAHLGEDRDELLIVDNGSTDRSLEILRGLETEFDPLLEVRSLPENRGTTVSRNLALRDVQGKYVLVMDSDVEVPVGTLEVLVQRLEDDPTTGLVCPRLDYPSGKLQISTDQFPTVTRKFRRFFFLKAMERSYDEAGPASEPMEVDYAISAFWLFPREVLEKVGLLDERIFYSPEDVDFCIRVWRAGYRIVYDPTVRAIHDAQEISRGLRLKKVTFSHVGGLFYLFRKHGYGLGLRRLYRRIGRNRSLVAAKEGT